MPDAEWFRGKAQQCRELLRSTTAPAVVAQLQMWEREFEERAAEIELRERGVVTLRSGE